MNKETTSVPVENEMDGLNIPSHECKEAGTANKVKMVLLATALGLSSCGKDEEVKPTPPPEPPKKETVALEIENLTHSSSTDTKVVFGMPANMVELKTSKSIGN